MKTRSPLQAHFVKDCYVQKIARPPQRRAINGPGSSNVGCGFLRDCLMRHVAYLAAAFVAAPALAAELPVRMPMKAPSVVAVPAPQLYDWTGWYVGVHMGDAWGKSNWTKPPINPVRSICSTAMTPSPRPVATSGASNSAMTTCCQTALSSAELSTRRFRASLTSMGSLSVALRPLCRPGSGSKL